MKDKKIKIHEFSLDIYPRKVWIAITTENKFDSFKELSDMDDSIIAVVNNAHDDVNDKGGVFIRFSSKKFMTSENISHEACHAAMEIFNYINAKVDLNNQETFCYLVGYIAKCCEQVKLNKFND